MLKRSPASFLCAPKSCVGKIIPYKLQDGGQRTQLPFHLFADPNIDCTSNASGVGSQDVVSTELLPCKAGSIY